MRTLAGTITEGSGQAAQHFERAREIIARKIGLDNLIPGTLNVLLEEEYGVTHNAHTDLNEYPDLLKLKRCRINGLKAVIVRPLSHEREGHDRLKCLEVMSPYHLRHKLNLKNDDRIEIEIEGNDQWWAKPDAV